MSRLEVPNDEYTIQSLSELYLASSNQNAPRIQIHTHTQNLLANLRRRLSMNPTLNSSQHRRRSTVTPSSAGAAHSPLELLFKPPKRFFVTKASQDSTHDSTSDDPDLSEQADSVITESQRMFFEHQLSSVTKAQCWVNDFLNRPQNPISIIYQLTLCVILLIYLLFIIFTDRTTWHKVCKPVDFDKNELTNNAKGLFEDCLITHFVLFEWFLRLWSSHAEPEYYRVPWHKYIFKYHYSWLHILDLSIVLAGTISATCEFPLPLDITQDVYAAIVLRGLHRLFIVAEWTSVQARHSPIDLIVQVFREQGPVLFGIFYLQSLLILVLAYTVFHAERHSPDASHEKPHFNNMLDAIYWATITLLTIGYGDKVPQTYIGKGVTAAGILVGMALFSFPAGIIATSLALKISENDVIELRYLKKAYAATIIQRTWRFYKREQRFQKALLIVSRYPDLISENDVNLKIVFNNSRNKTEKQLHKFKLNPKLKEQLMQVSKRRKEFHGSQFIDLLQMIAIRRKLTDLLKRQQGTSQLANSWQMIKAHWIEHQSLTALLEQTNYKVMSSTGQISCNLSATYIEEDSRNKQRHLNEFSKIQAELKELHNKLLKENRELKQLAAFNATNKSGIQS